MKHYDARRGLVALLFGFAVVLSLLCIPAAADGELPAVSYGVQVMAAQTDVAVAARVGNDVAFSGDLFARGMNLSAVHYLTVRSLPANTEGELLLGSSRVAVGQTVSGANLSHLCFSPAEESVRKASFFFSLNGSPVTMRCSLYFLENENVVPTVSMAPELSLNLSTHKNLRAYGMLSATDPDGDELCFEIVSFPKNGAVRLEDRAVGTYVYTPGKDFIGTDSFSYVARDRYGNYSAKATVNVRVSTSGTSVTYADMQQSKSYNAALTLTEAGIMSGKQVGNRYYFSPEETVNRADFLVMAMQAAGITKVPDCTETDFDDDETIPESMKGYVSAAYTLGYISGTNVKGKLCFLPQEPITRAEAAVLLGKILKLESTETTPVFADEASVPAWASDAVHALGKVGILLPTGGKIFPAEKLNRAQAAEILAAVMAYR